MAPVIVRRLLQMIPMLLGASLLIFLVIRLAPGDPFAGLIDPRTDPRQIEELRQRYCLDCPVLQQYGRWLSRALHGDLGESIRFRVPVAEIIAQRLGPTILLGLAAQLIAYLVGVPAGIVAAARQGTWIDALVTVAAFAGLSIPPFFVGLLLLGWLAMGGLQLFPTAGYATPGFGLEGLPLYLDIARHLALPALALGLGGVAGLMRYVRAAMLQVLRQDYLRTARAKGLSERVVICKHALRNALIPVITLIGLDLPLLVGGAIITESIFGWPGLGRLTYTALLERDYPVLMALNLMFAAFTMLGSLAADIGYALADARIRLS